MPGTTIPRGNLLNTMMFVTSITPTSVNAQTSNEQTFTIPGLAVSDYVNGGPSGAQTAGILTGTMRVTAPNTLSIQFVNVTGGTLTPASGNYGFVWGRAENPNIPNNVT